MLTYSQSDLLEVIERMASNNVYMDCPGSKKSVPCYVVRPAGGAILRGTKQKTKVASNHKS